MEISLITGSTTGKTELIGDELSELMNENKLKHNLIHTSDYTQSVINNGIWIILSSSYGEGEMPEDISIFFDNIIKSRKNLINIFYILIGVGSKNYENFCGGIYQIRNILMQNKAKILHKGKNFDVSNKNYKNDIIVNWFNTSIINKNILQKIV